MEGGQRIWSSHKILLRMEFIAWMLKTLYIFFVCKTLYKWILINFCFNTWYYFRLSCAMNFQGVCYSRLFLMWPWKEMHGTWKLRRRGFSSVGASPQPSQTVYGSCFVLFDICLTKKMIGDCDSLSCLDGCVMSWEVCAGRDAGDFPPFLPIAGGAQSRQLCDADAFSDLPSLLWASCFGHMGYGPTHKCFLEARSWPVRGTVWSCIINISHTSGIFLSYICK